MLTQTLKMKLILFDYHGLGYLALMSYSPLHHKSTTEFLHTSLCTELTVNENKQQ